MKKPIDILFKLIESTLFKGKEYKWNPGGAIETLTIEDRKILQNLKSEDIDSNKLRKDIWAPLN